MSVFPEFNTASFDSMYQMCYGCTALERVPTLDTSNVANMMYAFYGCTNLQRSADWTPRALPPLQRCSTAARTCAKSAEDSTLAR